MSIIHRKNKDGSYSYRVVLRTKKGEIDKTFHIEEDANLYEFYKKRLWNNMKNFDVPIKNRVTLNHVFDLKMQSKQLEHREISAFEHARNKLNEEFGNDKFLSEISYEEWINVCKKIYSTPTYIGIRTQKNQVIMQPTTLKRIFAYASSAISYAIYTGIEIENHALRVIQNHITPMIEKEKK